MKTLIILIIVSVAWFVGSWFFCKQIGEDYCDGFKVGYQAGYCFERPGCVSPAPPACPVPEPGYDSWDDGYNRGFSQGIKDRS